MDKSRYSEREAVQKPAGELLRTMGWDLVYCYDEEKLGTYGTLGREQDRATIEATRKLFRRGDCALPHKHIRVFLYASSVDALFEGAANDA